MRLKDPLQLAQEAELEARRKSDKWKKLSWWKKNVSWWKHLSENLRIAVRIIGSATLIAAAAAKLWEPVRKVVSFYRGAAEARSIRDKPTESGTSMPTVATDFQDQPDSGTKGEKEK